MSDSLERLKAARRGVIPDYTPVDDNEHSVSFEDYSSSPIDIGPIGSKRASVERIRAALEDHGDTDPTFDYVEREQFDEHVKEDFNEHEKIKEDVRFLKGAVGTIQKIDNIAKDVSLCGPETPAAISISTEALRVLANDLGLTPPSFASMEALDSWVMKLKNFLRVSVANYTGAAKDGVIRQVRSISNITKNLESVRRELDKLGFRDSIRIQLDKNSSVALAVGRPVTEVSQFLTPVAEMVSRVIEVHLSGTDSYLVSTDAIRRGIKEMSTLPEDDSEFEAHLRKIAQSVQSPEVYYEIEPGETVYPGNVRFKPIDFTPIRNYPEWFEPVLRMDSAPFFEVDKLRPSFGVSELTLDTTTCAKLLDFVDEAIKHLIDADLQWTQKILEMQTSCKETLLISEKWTNEEMANYSTLNKRMLDIMLKNMLLFPVVLSQPTTIMLNPLIDALYSIVSVVALAVKKAK